MDYDTAIAHIMGEMDDVEVDQVVQALETTDGNQEEAMKWLRKNKLDQASAPPVTEPPSDLPSYDESAMSSKGQVPLSQDGSDVNNGGSLAPPEKGGIGEKGGASGEKSLRQDQTSDNARYLTLLSGFLPAEHHQGEAGVALQEKASKGKGKMLFRRLTGNDEAKQLHRRAKFDEVEEVLKARFGPPGSPVFEIIRRYWQSTHMAEHWVLMAQQHPNDTMKHIKNGYAEPIPTEWVLNRYLAYYYPEGSYFETPAEERLYYFLNNGRCPWLPAQEKLRPLNINRDRYAIIARGNARNARAHALNPQRLAMYRSDGDVFWADNQIKAHDYSTQVDNIIYEERQRQLHTLADGIIHGTDHLETMLLIDISGSMTWNPHSGIPGPDGITRYHDQPSNISLVEHLVWRVLQHMVPRARKEHPNQHGIDTVTFSNYGRYIGQLSAQDFKQQWANVRLGGGTQVMQGWQCVKNNYFEHQHRAAGHGYKHPRYGWQPTPGMPKLSLLLFLDGECQDMDEFELELLGETWAYVTVALVGMEGCPHHHSHAIELERVAKFNPHVGFFDVHGRVCERMVVEDLLKSVYPVDPPGYEEILKPQYDLPPTELPPYKR